MRDQANALPGLLLRCCRDYFAGRLPAWVFFGLVLPAAYVSFGLGTGLAVAGLPSGFDRGRCVISRLCSSHHNPDGYRFLTFGLIGLALFLAPLPAWITRTMEGSPLMRTRGRWTYRVGLVATALIAVERGLCPTHWTRFELAHLALAATAFFGLWLGLAVMAGASEMPRVPYRWFFRPPWFLAACVLPIVVVTVLYFPLHVVPKTLGRALPALPRPLVLLRTETFWQWYLVLGLLFSSGALAVRVYRQARRDRARAEPWRVDVAQGATPHRGAGDGPGLPAVDDRVGEIPSEVERAGSRRDQGR